MRTALLLLLLCLPALSLGACGGGSSLRAFGVGVGSALDDPHHDPYCDCYSERLAQQQIDPEPVPGPKW